MKTKGNLFALFALLMLVLSACTPMVVPVSAAMWKWYRLATAACVVIASIKRTDQ